MKLTMKLGISVILIVCILSVVTIVVVNRDKLSINSHVKERFVLSASETPATTASSSTATAPPSASETPATTASSSTAAGDEVICNNADIAKAIEDAFGDILGRVPTDAEKSAYTQRMASLTVDKDKCYTSAKALMTTYLSRNKEDASISQTKKSETVHMLTLSEAEEIYINVFGRKPPPAMQEVLELKLKSSPPPTAEGMRIFLQSLRDADPEVSSKYIKSPSLEDPLYNGLKAVQPSTNTASSQSIDADVLRGVVCNNAAFIDPSDPHKETMLADLMKNRNDLQLINLCQRSSDKSIPEEMRLNDARFDTTHNAPCNAKDGGMCADGTKWINTTTLKGTPLAQSSTSTAVGSLMPRFIFAEYV